MLWIIILIVAAFAAWFFFLKDKFDDYELRKYRLLLDKLSEMNLSFEDKRVVNTIKNAMWDRSDATPEMKKLVCDIIKKYHIEYVYGQLGTEW